MASNNVWAKVRLGDIGRIITGKTPPSSIAGCFDGTTLFITPSDMDGRKTISGTQRCLSHAGVSTVGKVLIPKNSVMVSCIGSDLGKVALAGDECVTNQQINSIVTNNDVDPEFVYYSLLPRKKEFRDFASGSAQPIINKSHFSEIKINLPPLKEQRHIARILGSLDDKINLNRRMNETLEATARAIFQSWFVDFDPVRAKAEGRQPFGMDSETAALFPDLFDESEMGQIPKGSAFGQLSDITGFLNGYSFKSSDWIGEGIPVVKIGSVKPGIVDLNQVSFVSEDIAEEAKKYRLRQGDLLIGMTGYIGEVGIIPPTDNPPLLNQRVGKFEFGKGGTDELAFIYCLTRQPIFKLEVEARGHGTAQANVGSKDILSIPIIVPPQQVRSAFNCLCKPIFDQILNNHAQLSVLSTLRDTLLPKLLSGELKTPESITTKSS